MSRILGVRLHVAGLTAALLLSSPSVNAQTAPSQRSEELSAARHDFARAVELQEKGQFVEALELYGRVRAVAVSPTILFNIATCHERLDHLVASERVYEEAAALARERGDTDVNDAASARLALIRPALPKLAIQLAADTKSPTVMLDGAVIEPSSFPSVRLDPGAHRLAARSPHHEKTFDLAFDIARGATREVAIDLGPVLVEPARTSDGQALRALPPEQEVRRSNYTPALVAGGAALALTTGAIVTGVIGSSLRSEYTDLNGRPTEENRARREDLRSEGSTMYTTNTVLASAAILAAAIGVYLVLRPPTTSVSPKMAGVRF